MSFLYRGGENGWNEGDEDCLTEVLQDGEVAGEDVRHPTVSAAGTTTDIEALSLSKFARLSL